MLQAEAAACAKAQRQKKQSTLGNLAKKNMGWSTESRRELNFEGRVTGSLHQARP